jgi:hypothetical protein
MRQIERTAEDRTIDRVGIDTSTLDTCIGHIDVYIELVEEVALLRCIHHIIYIVRAEGEALIVALSVVTAYDTLLLIIAHREIVVDFF